MLSRPVDQGRRSVKKPLLIITRQQFGYHIDTLYYCRLLREHFDITYAGWDFGRPRIVVDGVKALYLPRSQHWTLRYMLFLWRAWSLAQASSGLVFLLYSPGFSLLATRDRRNSTVLDIRTAAVSGGFLRRWLFDRLMRLEARAFRYVTIISASLAARLKMPRCHVLPLGAQELSHQQKEFYPARLLYVGTLYGRQIEDTVRGLRLFLDTCETDFDCHYTIVGAGPGNEVNALRQLVERLSLGAYVSVVGQVPHTELPKYFEQANIGISYIPTTEFYDAQPPTKTFEYLMSGMAVVATRTQENARVVNKCNGVLIEATADGFANGLRMLITNHSGFNSSVIRASVAEYKWSAIVSSNLIPYLNKVGR